MWYNRHAKQDIRQGFVDEAMARDENVRSVKLTKTWIERLFNHYHILEQVIDWYDSETVTCCSELDGESMQERPVTWDERMSFCNWQDVSGEGIWDASQKAVDRAGKADMNDFRKAGHLAGRCWAGEGEWDGIPYLHVFLYGRDIHEFDIHFTFLKSKHPCKEVLEHKKESKE